jgi:hypothetical protein
VTSNSASVAAGLEEMEKRHKVERLQDGAVVQETCPVKPDDMPMSATIAPKTKLFSWKVAAVTITLFAAFGAILAFTPLAPAAALFGMHGAAAVIASAAMFGMFGSLLGVKNSLVTNKVNNFYFKLLTEQYFEKSPEKAKEMAPQPVAAMDHAPAPAMEIAPGEIQKKSFADSVVAQRGQDIAASRAV